MMGSSMDLGKPVIEPEIDETSVEPPEGGEI